MSDTKDETAINGQWHVRYATDINKYEVLGKNFKSLVDAVKFYHNNRSFKQPSYIRLLYHEVGDTWRSLIPDEPYFMMGEKPTKDG